MTRNMAGHCTLPRLRPQELTIAVDTGPIAVDKGHGVAANWAVGWRTLVKKWEIWELNIVFVH